MRSSDRTILPTTDFADLDLAFFANAVGWPSVAERFLAVGIFKGAVVAALVYRPLGVEAISVISMRRASRKERKQLHDQQT
jgi:uncharacterized DUF497 family protein